MKCFKYLLLFICFVPLFIFRDFTPNNELKYLSIADEALRNGNFFTFWNHGMAYADKPPLYLWIVMAGKWLLGFHSMFFLGLFSILPALIILYVMDKWTRYSIKPGLRTSGQLMLITSGLFVGSAVVLRMDMLMCMFIILSLYTFYKLYTGNYRKMDKILLPVYIFMAVFSKGPVGLVVPLLSISVFLLVKGEIRNFGKYLGWKQFTILLGLCTVWFGGVYMEGGSAYLENLLFHQTVNRAIDSFHHKEPVWYYLKTIWYSLAPWVLFYVVVIVAGIRKRIVSGDLEKLFLTIIVTTFIVLSLFSGKLDIYMLPVFPFFTYLALLLLPEINEKTVRFTVAIPAGILAFTFPALFILTKQPNLSFLSMPVILIAAAVLSLSAISSLFYIFRKQLCFSINSLSVGLLLTIFTGSFAIPEFNKNIGWKELTAKAQRLAAEKGIETYYFCHFRSGENLDAYLGKEVKKINPEEIQEAATTRNFILFLRNEDIPDEKILKEITDNKESYRIGDYSIIIFQLN